MRFKRTTHEKQHLFLVFLQHISILYVGCLLALCSGMQFVRNSKLHIMHCYEWQLFVDSLAFSLGLATTLAVLGIGASLAGKAYGQIGQGIPIAVSVVAMIMGLNLLEVRFLAVRRNPSLPLLVNHVLCSDSLRELFGDVCFENHRCWLGKDWLENRREFVSWCTPSYLEVNRNWCNFWQIIELQFPSLFGNFDARKAAATLPPSALLCFSEPYAYIISRFLMTWRFVCCASVRR